MLNPCFMASITLINIIYDAIIIIAELMFMLVFVRFVFFNGEWKEYSLFAKILTIIFTIFVLLILVAIFLTVMRVD
ncbi:MULTISPECIES: hypothetical protein [unclassified Butyrivibrio]|uniref:hypothetical protein n=1 Tax=unclassified Butyrivibrio TaxID=2639466 RepID=UPI0004279111|nr:MULTISPECIES: hypothetical protein [unclassified Butyrivibrio]